MNGNGVLLCLAPFKPDLIHRPIEEPAKRSPMWRDDTYLEEYYRIYFQITHEIHGRVMGCQ